MPLLNETDPKPVITKNLNGGSRFILTVDHADRAIPQALGDLGVSQEDWDRHIAYDIGILGVSELLSELLDAPMIGQRYSRLIIDCNRRPGVAASMPHTSDGTEVPANQQLSDASRRQREAEIFHPYHEQIERSLEEHGHKDPIFIAMHSFTPFMNDAQRPWHVGLLTHDDRRLAAPILDNLKSSSDLVVGDNDPYAVCPINDYGLMVHAYEKQRLHAGFEIRQDLITSPDGQKKWAERLANALQPLLQMS